MAEHPNVAIVRSAYDAFAKGDLDGALRDLADDCVFHFGGEGPNSGDHKGREAISAALIHKGARSVVLSRWKVDDTATSLLMRRFYQNILGKRDGLKRAMGRADALAEAKAWLRNLNVKEAQSAADSLPRGKLAPAPKVAPKAYAHPYYWAAFTLVGDPD